MKYVTFKMNLNLIWTRMTSCGLLIWLECLSCVRIHSFYILKEYADWFPQLNQVTNDRTLSLLCDSQLPLVCFWQHHWSRQDSLVPLLILIGHCMCQITQEDFKALVRFSYTISSSLVQKRNKESDCNIFSHVYIQY